MLVEISRLGGLILNVSCTVFFAHLVVVGGYFARYSRRTYRLHVWMAILGLVTVALAALITLLVTTTTSATAPSSLLWLAATTTTRVGSRRATGNVEAMLVISALQFLLVVGTLRLQKLCVSEKKCSDHVFMRVFAARCR